MTRVAIYTRFSTDLQRDESLADQDRVCRDYAAKQGWQVVRTYKDRALSGADMNRPGLQSMIGDASDGDFDLVLSEALDRLSRDQSDIAFIYKEFKFLEVGIHTLAENDVNELHIGLKGTMNALFLADLKKKIRRGMSGKVVSGKSAGGMPYGYEVDRTNPEPGARKIVPEHAAIITRVMQEYVLGESPRSIAQRLNREEIPGPTGKGWTASTINGNRKRGIGILNNEAYAGILRLEPSAFPA